MKRPMESHKELNRIVDTQKSVRTKRLYELVVPILHNNDDLMEANKQHKKKIKRQQRDLKNLKEKIQELKGKNAELVGQIAEKNGYF